eukprot:7380554-Prymnesium_polylepis.2
MMLLLSVVAIVDADPFDRLADAKIDLEPRIRCRRRCEGVRPGIRAVTPTLARLGGSKATGGVGGGGAGVMGNNGGAGGNGGHAGGEGGDGGSGGVSGGDGAEGGNGPDGGADEPTAKTSARLSIRLLPGSFT